MTVEEIRKMTAANLKEVNGVDILSLKNEEGGGDLRFARHESLWFPLDSEDVAGKMLNHEAKLELDRFVLALAVTRKLKGASAAASA